MVRSSSLIAHCPTRYEEAQTILEVRCVERSIWISRAVSVVARIVLNSVCKTLVLTSSIRRVGRYQR